MKRASALFARRLPAHDPLDPDSRLYLRPVGLLSGPAAAAAIERGEAKPLAGGPLAFMACEIAVRKPARIRRAVASLTTLARWARRQGREAAVGDRLARLSQPRPLFAGLGSARPLVMGVVNVTPDSFSDGGDHADADAALAHGIRLLEQGADILDVGGESTRPGSQAVSPEAEAARVLPVVRGLAERGAAVSIDTRRASVMAVALAAGARVVNDVTALEGDPGSLGLVARSGASAILMHMQGEPRTMQADPRYVDVALDVYDYLEARIAACAAAGIGPERIAVDPGIGFGKTVAHNLEILDALALYQGLGANVLLGVSRKSFIAKLSIDEPPKRRLPGSLAAAQVGLDRGVQILRVHDVAETVQAVKVWQALSPSPPRPELVEGRGRGPG
jgi:dihydropteroate synthase